MSYVFSFENQYVMFEAKKIFKKNQEKICKYQKKYYLCTRIDELEVIMHL